MFIKECTYLEAIFQIAHDKLMFHFAVENAAAHRSSSFRSSRLVCMHGFYSLKNTMTCHLNEVDRQQNRYESLESSLNDLA
jgi:hypothetical protein